jgi:hypothetical protein
MSTGQSNTLPTDAIGEAPPPQVGEVGEAPPPQVGEVGEAPQVGEVGEAPPPQFGELEPLTRVMSELAPTQLCWNNTHPWNCRMCGEKFTKSLNAQMRSVCFRCATTDRHGVEILISKDGSIHLFRGYLSGTDYDFMMEIFNGFKEFRPLKVFMVNYLLNGYISPEVMDRKMVEKCLERKFLSRHGDSFDSFVYYVEHIFAPAIKRVSLDTQTETVKVILHRTFDTILQIKASSSIASSEQDGLRK